MLIKIFIMALILFLDVSLVCHWICGVISHPKVLSNLEVSNISTSPSILFKTRCEHAHVCFRIRVFPRNWNSRISPAVGHCVYHGFLTYTKLRIVHAPVMPGTFSTSPRVSVPDIWRMCRDACGIANCRFPLKSVAGKRSRYSRRMRKPQFCVSGKRHMIYFGKTWFIVVQMLWLLSITVFYNRDIMFCWVQLWISAIFHNTPKFIPWNG